MSQKFAILYMVPGQEQTHFVITQAQEPVGALQTAAQSLIDEGVEDAQMVAVFTPADLEGVLEKMKD